jgi:hypothetical protein
MSFIKHHQPFHFVGILSMNSWYIVYTPQWLWKPCVVKCKDRFKLCVRAFREYISSCKWLNKRISYLSVLEWKQKNVTYVTHYICSERCTWWHILPHSYICALLQCTYWYMYGSNSIFYTKLLELLLYIVG